jgi:hypothetical protein
MSLPKAKPDVSGMVIDSQTAEGMTGVLIGAKTKDGVARQARAIVRVTPKTRLFDADGKRLKDGSALGLGDSVKVWYSGPVAESDPVRADARVLQITVDNP